LATVVDLVIDPLGREKIRLEVPPTFRIPAAEARRALELPEFVDLSDPTVARAVVLLEAARTRAEPRLSLAFLGGVAYRLRCPSSNDPGSGLRRPLHDIDLACRHREMKRVRRFLDDLPAVAGSALAIFETPADRMFNALLGGRRLRFHNLHGFDGNRAQLGIVDLIADEFRFCHNLDLRADLDRARDLGYTLSAELLLLTKLQYIQGIPAEHAARVSDRVLRPFGRDRVLIGPEDKDVRDVLAVLVDCRFGEDPRALSLARFARFFDANWGLWMTVTLNLEALPRTAAFSRLRPDLQASVRERVEALREATRRAEPKRGMMRFRHEWWEEVESPPAGETQASMGAGPAVD
jgi:hypothetical protein